MNEICYALERCSYEICGVIISGSDVPGTPDCCPQQRRHTDTQTQRTPPRRRGLQRWDPNMSSRQKKPDARALFKQARGRKGENVAGGSTGAAQGGGTSKYHGKSKEEVRKRERETERERDRPWPVLREGWSCCWAEAGAATIAAAVTTLCGRVHVFGALATDGLRV